jgi:hypothetical protein
MLVRNAALALISAIFCLCAYPAFAQQGKGRGERVCAEDAKKFCSDVRPGGGRMYQCMTKNNDQLSPACRERMTQGKARWDQFVSACKDDAAKHCKGVPPGSGRVLSCLKGQEANLAPDCKAQFSRASKDSVVSQ